MNLAIEGELIEMRTFPVELLVELCKAMGNDYSVKAEVPKHSNYYSEKCSVTWDEG